MIDRLIEFLSGREAPAVEDSADDLEFAVAALLVEAARMDETFGAGERTVIENLLAARFDLAPARAHALIEEAHATVQDSAHYFPFTREICEKLSARERAQIIEMLWHVAYADGVLDPHEDALVRQIAGLIHVTDRERMLARQRALSQRGIFSSDADD